MGVFFWKSEKTEQKVKIDLQLEQNKYRIEVSLPEMVPIFKSPSPAFQAFHHAKVERLRFTRHNRRENEHR
jgi:hypothetical protein